MCLAPLLRHLCQWVAVVLEKLLHVALQRRSLRIRLILCCQVELQVTARIALRIQPQLLLDLLS